LEEQRQDRLGYKECKVNRKSRAELKQEKNYLRFSLSKKIHKEIQTIFSKSKWSPISKKYSKQTAFLTQLYLIKGDRFGISLF